MFRGYQAIRLSSVEVQSWVLVVEVRSGAEAISQKLMTWHNIFDIISMESTWDLRRGIRTLNPPRGTSPQKPQEYGLFNVRMQLLYRVVLLESPLIHRVVIAVEMIRQAEHAPDLSTVLTTPPAALTRACSVRLLSMRWSAVRDSSCSARQRVAHRHINTVSASPHADRGLSRRAPQCNARGGALLKFIRRG